MSTSYGTPYIKRWQINYRKILLTRLGRVKKQFVREEYVIKDREVKRITKADKDYRQAVFQVLRIKV